MQNIGENVRVAKNDRYGLHFISTIYVAPGEDILNEKPLLVAPHWDCDQMKCSNCFENSYVMCKKCKVFALCLDCHSHDNFDCNFFASLDEQAVSRDLLVKNNAVFAVLKLLLMLENPETRSYCEQLFTKEINLDEYRATGMWKERQQTIVDPLLESGLANVLKATHNVNSDLLQKLCILIDAHSFEVVNRDGCPLKGVYVCGSKIPHSCVSNTVIAIDDNFNMKIYAATTIQHGEVIYNSYANPLLGTSQRQHQLRTTRHFDCKCKRCSDPTELGTHMSTMKCKQCEDGYAVCDLGGSGNWICMSCRAIIDALEVHSILAEVSEGMACADGNAFIYERLLAKYEHHFHPNHFIVIDLKQNIAQILRTILMDSMCKPGRKILERRVQLCEEILPVVKAVTPGISRMYAIALYEYMLSFRELIDRSYLEHDISIITYVDSLHVAKEICATVCDLLMYEPINSPEGQLTQTVRRELKRVDDKVLSLTY